MSDIVHESLKKMGVGTSIILIGTIVSMLFEFLSRILIIHSTSTAEYGIFSLAIVILYAMYATAGIVAVYHGFGEMRMVNTFTPLG